MTRYRVVVTTTAMTNIEEQVTYIRSDSLSEADRWFEGCIAAIQSLETLPLRGAIAPESEAFDREIRHIIYHSHRILYEVTGATVVVLHIRHAARLPLGEDQASATEPESSDD